MIQLLEEEKMVPHDLREDNNNKFLTIANCLFVYNTHEPFIDRVDCNNSYQSGRWVEVDKPIETIFKNVNLRVDNVEFYILATYQKVKR